MFENRLYYILDFSENNKIDFDEILHKDLDSLRKSPDGSRCLIKIEGSPKGFLNTINSLSGPFTHSEIKNKLRSKNWD
jgi:hypothetical protein